MCGGNPQRRELLLLWGRLLYRGRLYRSGFRLLHGGRLYRLCLLNRHLEQRGWGRGTNGGRLLRGLLRGRGRDTGEVRKVRHDKTPIGLMEKLANKINVSGFTSNRNQSAKIFHRKNS